MTILMEKPTIYRNNISSTDPESPMTVCPDRTQVTREEMIALSEVPDWASQFSWIDSDGKPKYYVWTCKACRWITSSDGETVYPKRCIDCCKQYNLWRRCRTWRKKFKQWFCPEIHVFVKFLTLTVELHEILPGDGNQFTISKKELIDRARTKLTSAFKKMRRTATWKKYVDGGLWFFEWTEHEESDEIIWTDFNPHLHVILLSKYFPQKEIKKLSEHYGLGRIVDIQADKTKTFDDSLAYITHYAKKQYQCEGRNRNAFGYLTRAPR